MSGKERCLIYGGGGFIGSHLAEKLLESGYSVTIFDKLNFSGKNISDFTDKINIIEGDFNNEMDLKNSLKDIDHVYHLVSSTLPATSNENPVYDVETNLVSSLKLIKECINKKIKKFIFLSSGGTVYGIPEKIPIAENHRTNPICSYGIVKKTIEEYLFMYEKIHGLDYFVFRLSNPYGERQNPLAAQGVIPVFINQAIYGQPISIWGNGEVIRDYIYIKDAVEVLAEALSMNSSHRVFNLSSGTGYSLNQIIEMIEAVSGMDLNVIYKEGRNVDVPVNILDNTLVRGTFNWNPDTTIKTGINRTYKYLVKHNV